MANRTIGSSPPTAGRTSREAVGPVGVTPERVVAIHQPNFFPWLGWFHKLASADVFILLDDAEFSRGSWINRTRLLVNGEAVWMTAPVERAADDQEIRAARITEDMRWRGKFLKTIENSYRRSPGFEEVLPVLAPLVESPTNWLATYNEDAIRAIARLLGLDVTRFVHSSAIGSTARATERLVELVQAVGGSCYLSGRGAGAYQKDECFEQAGIKVTYTDYEVRPYPQRAAEFVPGLSVIDALMNTGVEGTRGLVVSAPAA